MGEDTIMVADITMDTTIIMGLDFMGGDTIQLDTTMHTELHATMDTVIQGMKDTQTDHAITKTIKTVEIITIEIEVATTTVNAHHKIDQNLYNKDKKTVLMG